MLKPRPCERFSDYKFSFMIVDCYHFSYVRVPLHAYDIYKYIFAHIWRPHNCWVKVTVDLTSIGYAYKILRNFNNGCWEVVMVWHCSKQNGFRFICKWI